jgi:hypothetical protein
MHVGPGAWRIPLRYRRASRSTYAFGYLYWQCPLANGGVNYKSPRRLQALTHICQPDG